MISQLYGNGAAVPTSANTLNNMGLNYWRMRDYKKAEICFSQSLTMNRELSLGRDTHAIAQTLNNIGVNYSDMGEYRRAEEY